LGLPPKPVDGTAEMIQKPLQFVQRGRILLRCGSAFGVIAALLGRFLPRLGPLANASGPFFFFLFLFLVIFLSCDASFLGRLPARSLVLELLFLSWNRHIGFALSRTRK
jgi:hypothetical protein